MKLLLQAAILCSSAYALDSIHYTSESKVWNDGMLPGDVKMDDTEETPGFVASPPKELHGGSVYAAWQVTNGFARFWNLAYSLFSFRGEPKHGLWRWTLPGARSIWWCDLGAFADSEGSTQGVAALWQQLQKSPKMYSSSSGQPVEESSLGRAGREAKLHELAIDIFPVQLSIAAKAQVWKHTGVENELKFHPYGSYGEDAAYIGFYHAAVEIYLFRAYYEYDANAAMFDKFGPNSAHPCSGDDYLTDSICAANMHTFISVVFPNRWMDDNTKAFTGFGIHYMGDTGCPESCGEKSCLCDGILADLSFDANMIDDGWTTWSSQPFYLPKAYPSMAMEEPEPEG